MPSILRQESQKVLDNVPQDYVFYIHDGGTLANLTELGEALNSMSDEVFAYHVNASKNDFSNWVRDIIKDDRLASDLNKAANKAQAARIVSDRLATIRKRAR